MLEYLRIENLALIKDMALDFAPGLNVLTGETGAGKSFILKAVDFLAGDKLTVDMVRPGEDGAKAEALFILKDESPEHGSELILKRELSSTTNRSRVFLNDGLSSQEKVKALRPLLILHTSQRGQQKLLQPAYQVRILDSFLEDTRPLLEKERLTAELRRTAEAIDEVEERSRVLMQQREFLEYQKQEIAKVDPKPGEEEELEAKRREMKEHTQTEEAVTQALSLLVASENGILGTTAALERNLETVKRIIPEYAEDLEAVQEFRQRLSDLEARLRRQKVYGPDEMNLEQIESRLFALAQLKRKLKRSLEDIVNLKQEIENNLSFLDSCTLDLNRLKKKEEELVERLKDILDRLNRTRKTAADALTENLENELKTLGFSEHVQIRFEFSPHPLFGDDRYPELLEERVRFMWLPNPGQPAQPLDKIASGGELSRFLLAVVGLVAKADSPTLIFDEVDAGVGGITLNRVGERLKALSRRQQVILITHWPQLAALADRHFHVRKDVTEGMTYTSCVELNEQERFEELARMAGGGERGSALAKELLGK